VKDRAFGVIWLRGIRAWGRHGANPGEQDIAQPFEIDLMLNVDPTAACKSDELADTVDYAAVHARVVRIVETEHYHLLERLGDAILTAVMEDDRIESATVFVAKPKLLDGATPSVTLTARRTPAARKGRKTRKNKKKREA
jgi:dihydroneopterin aldolase